MITKYKDVDYKLQSSRKRVKLTTILFFILIIIIFSLHFITEGAIPLQASLLFIILLCFYLFDKDWSISIENDILTVRKWIFRFNIHIKDIINIVDNVPEFSRDASRNYIILIIYKKGNQVRHLRLKYLYKEPFIKIEYAKEDEVSEFINIFVREEELINNKTETNISDGNYRNIRTEQEKNELKDFLQNKKKSEEKIMWILLFGIIFVPVIFLTILFTAF